MKKFGGLLNKKFSSSGKLDEDFLRGDAEYQEDEHVEDDHNSFTSPNQKKPTYAGERSFEDIRVKKSFSLRSLSPFKPQESMDTDEDFTKKKSSSMRNIPPTTKERDNKLGESDERVIKKSFSLVSLFKQDHLLASDAPKSPNSRKSIFGSQHEPVHDTDLDGNDEDLDEEGDEAQAVPKRSQHTHHDNLDMPSMRVPLSPSPLSSSARSTTSPPLVSMPGGRTTSPPLLSMSGGRTTSPPLLSMPGGRTTPPPLSISGRTTSPPPRVPSPPLAHSSPAAARVPLYHHAQPEVVPASPVLVADDFDAQFGRMRTDSITDSYGMQNAENSDNEDSDEGDHLKGKKSGGSSLSLFSSGKSKKAK